LIKGRNNPHQSAQMSATEIAEAGFRSRAIRPPMLDPRSAAVSACAARMTWAWPPASGSQIQTRAGWRRDADADSACSAFAQ